MKVSIVIPFYNEEILFPKMMAAVTEQLGKFTHTAYQIAPYESYITLVEKIIARAPIKAPAKRFKQ